MLEEKVLVQVEELFKDSLIAYAQKIETFINPRKAEMGTAPFSRGAGVPHRN